MMQSASHVAAFRRRRVVRAAGLSAGSCCAGGAAGGWGGGVLCVPQAPVARAARGLCVPQAPVVHAVGLCPHPSGSALCGAGAVIRHGTPDYDAFLAFVKKYFSFVEISGERASLATVMASDGGNKGSSAPSTAGATGAGQGPGPGSSRGANAVPASFVADEVRRFNDLNFTVRLDRPVSLDGALSPQHWQHALRIVSFYVDYRLKQPFSKLRALHDGRRSLPIAAYEDTILAAVRAHQVILVSGDTGCGKSTQVPQFLLRAGFSKIACTQPRRLSAMALCRRVAFETMNAYGSQVAYSIRFDSTRTASTRILFLTEGVLLRQLGSDPTLAQYDVIIVDEVGRVCTAQPTPPFAAPSTAQLGRLCGACATLCRATLFVVPLVSHSGVPYGSCLDPPPPAALANKMCVCVHAAALWPAVHG
jgi:hypothetical protein